MAALTSGIWSPKLSFLSGGGWLIGFVLAAAGDDVFTLQDSVLTGLRAAKWIPLENSLYALAKLLLLVVLAEHPDRLGALRRLDRAAGWSRRRSSTT